MLVLYFAVDQHQLTFLSVAMTTPSFAAIPREVRPLLTALRAYSIWRSLPVREKVVSENE